jgi:hypothetical protein
MANRLPAGHNYERDLKTGVIKTRAAADQYIKEDLFILEGVVKSIEIREWKDSLLPE